MIAGLIVLAKAGAFMLFLAGAVALMVWTHETIYGKGTSL